jgi:hypothetical protein
MELNGWTSPRCSPGTAPAPARRPRPPQLRPHHGRQHMTPAITASRNSARASGPHDLAELRGQRGHGKPGMDADAPARKTSPGAAPSWHTPKLCPAAAAPRTRRCPCPAPALRPRPWPSHRVNCRTMLNPACSAYRRLFAVLRPQVSASSRAQISRIGAAQPIGPIDGPAASTAGRVLLSLSLALKGPAGLAEALPPRTMHGQNRRSRRGGPPEAGYLGRGISFPATWPRGCRT